VWNALLSALERSRREFEADPTAKLLRERIAYHRATIAEERAAKGDSRPT
jgi:hypothetical protein